jgi:pyruvate dehydrogenase E2 component (dihydrolipoamide acetyltransferase)
VDDDATFAAQDTLATVETEKAVVDVEAEAAGVLLRTLVGAGAAVPVGAPIAVLGEPGEQVDDVDALLVDLGVGDGARAGDPQELMVADDPEGGTANTQGPEADGQGATPATVTPQVPPHVPPGPVEPTVAPERNGRVFASPLARRLAREAGLAVTDIAGTGPGGRIVRRDVEAALAAGRASARATEVPAPAAAEPSVVSPVSTTTDYSDVPHSRMRKAIATRLLESKQTTPHFYLRATVRVDKLLKLRRQLNELGGPRVSVNDMVIKAAAQAHTMVPAMNAIWTPEAIRTFSSVDLSVAVATDTGLLTPVLRRVDQMSISAVATTVRDLVERAKAGRLRQEELEGGSFSVTNLGMYGTEEFAAIINPPQSAILAVGAARAAPVASKGKVSVATVMRVTLSVDHRAVDGALAATWMESFVRQVESPLRILA